VNGIPQALYLRPRVVAPDPFRRVRAGEAEGKADPEQREHARLGDRASARRELAAALGLRQDFREAGEARRVVEELR
jgi:hypothetical protein